MRACSPRIRKRSRNTRAIAERCTFRLERLAGQFPLFPVPEDERSAPVVSAHAGLPRRRRALRFAVRSESRAAARIRARHHRAHGSRRLLPGRVGHRARGEELGVLVPGPRLGRQLRGVLRARHHRRRSDRRRTAVRTLPVAKSATRFPTSTSTSRIKIAKK